mmetsp:Transcript_19547/g.43178  ORF Transcript_19547/g.43178 Transcript_19547/m.43178 type:complete len:257 (+) Transcript_19547:1180-1950(+)
MRPDLNEAGRLGSANTCRLLQDLNAKFHGLLFSASHVDPLLELCSLGIAGGLGVRQTLGVFLQVLFGGGQFGVQLAQFGHHSGLHLLLLCLRLGCHLHGVVPGTLRKLVLLRSLGTILLCTAQFILKVQFQLLKELGDATCLEVVVLGSCRFFQQGLLLLTQGHQDQGNLHDLAEKSNILIHLRCLEAGHCSSQGLDGHLQVLDALLVLLLLLRAVIGRCCGRGLELAQLLCQGLDGLSQLLLFQGFRFNLSRGLL